jgi:DNA-binding response OmpR family regulator
MTHRDLADQTTRPAWIALACDGPALALGDAVQAVPEPSAFLALLDAGRPRIAVVAEPPASPEVFEHLVDERRRRPRFRIVHLAAETAVEARLRALRLGFDEALPATIAPSELLGRLALLDERAHPRNGGTIAVGDDLDLDPVAHQLRRDGRPVHLRPKEYGLLALLAAHPGRAYTRQQILQRVWGADRNGDPRTVDVHVRWLRAKIESDPAHPTHLVTLRGVGYRLDPPDR